MKNGDLERAMELFTSGDYTCVLCKGEVMLTGTERGVKPLLQWLDRISFDAYNEGDHDEFEAVVEKYRERFGYYPERILADKIYRSRKNRELCKRHGIRLAGPKLGKPGKNHMEEMRQELKEIGKRNAVEGKFGNGKRK